jgi:hypothetical protein
MIFKMAFVFVLTLFTGALALEIHAGANEPQVAAIAREISTDVPSKKFCILVAWQAQEGYSQFENEGTDCSKYGSF